MHVTEVKHAHGTPVNEQLCQICKPQVTYDVGDSKFPPAGPGKLRVVHRKNLERSIHGVDRNCETDWVELLADFVVGKFEMFQGFHFAKRVCGDDGDVVSVENQHFELCRGSQDDVVKPCQAVGGEVEVANGLVEVGNARQVCAARGNIIVAVARRPTGHRRHVSARLPALLGFCFAHAALPAMVLSGCYDLVAGRTEEGTADLVVYVAVISFCS